jgi:hypothetical protein
MIRTGLISTPVKLYFLRTFFETLPSPQPTSSIDETFGGIMVIVSFIRIFSLFVRTISS